MHARWLDPPDPLPACVECAIDEATNAATLALEDTLGEDYDKAIAATIARDIRDAVLSHVDRRNLCRNHHEDYRACAEEFERECREDR
jgi:hypothetical protein